MKNLIPEAVNAAPPTSRWGKLIAATPVVMTVIATLLAGLANSEMTKAQYDRSLAAQQQSKAGDQWGFFQAKRIRSAIQSGTLDVVQLTGGDQPIDVDGLRALAATLPNPAGVQSALTHLLSGRLPDSPPAAGLDPKVKVALDGMDRLVPEPELARLLQAATPQMVATALQAAQEEARNFDTLLRPVVTSGDQLGDQLEPADTKYPALSRNFATLRLRYSSMRYDAESRLNQRIAVLRELQVRQSNLSAERHHLRSQRFFYGMLAAQAGVIIATFAMAARQRSLLWMLAAAAGLAAVSFAIYVYVFI